MANLRVVYNNAADKANVTSTATAGSLVVANLLTDIKSSVCRSVGTTLTITLTWDALTPINVVALAPTNFSSTATLNLKAYANTSDTNAIYDVTSLCAQGGLTESRGVNSFAYGGGVYAVHWLNTKILAKKLVITISDASNPQGYLEAGRLIVGEHWAPSFGAEQEGTTMTLQDDSEQSRTENGNMHVTVKARYRKQTLSLPSLNKDDRQVMWRILWNNGVVKPMFMSLHPNNTDKELEQAHMIYGRMVSTPVMRTPYFSYHAATIEIEEI